MKVNSMLALIWLSMELIAGESKYLTSSQELVLTDFIKHRRVRSCIFVENDILMDYSIFKTFSSKTYVSVKSESDLFRYILFVWTAFENPNTLIVYNEVQDLNNLGEFVSYLRQVEDLNFFYLKIGFTIFLKFQGKTSFFMGIFTWIIFHAIDINFFIPYDCDFFVVQPFDFTSYKISKTYNFRDYQTQADYGRCSDGKKCNLSTPLKYPGTINMNQTVFVGFAQKCSEVRINIFFLKFIFFAIIIYFRT